MIPEGIDGLQVELGGEAFAEFEPPSSEAIGLAFAIFILILAFGSVLAMGLPIGVALFGIGTGTALITLGSHFMSMPDFTTLLATMIGLGVGIDYALFIVTRYREGLHHGLDPEQATVTAIDTAGRAVIFAGHDRRHLAAGHAADGPGLRPRPRHRRLGHRRHDRARLDHAAAGAAGLRPAPHRGHPLARASSPPVFVALALLAFGLKVPAAGRRVPASLAVVTIGASFFVRKLRTEVPRRPPKPVRQTFWYRWSRIVQHRPWPCWSLGLGILLLLALPVLSLRLGFSDKGNYPRTRTTRQAYDLTRRGLRPRLQRPAHPGHRRSRRAATRPRPLDRISTRRRRHRRRGVRHAPRSSTTRPNPTAAQWLVIPSDHARRTPATTQLVHHLRDDVLPAATDGTQLDVAVTGTVAANIDFADYLANRMPLFFGAVLALSFLLLMVVFRSLLVPLKAGDRQPAVDRRRLRRRRGDLPVGLGQDLIGIGEGGPIEAWVPMMMFAIVFGLSMDYEVFLLSRIREEYDRTGDNATAVADGLATTARVITAAAAIMVVVFGSFLLEDEPPDQAVRPRPGRRRPARRHRRAHGAGAGHDGAARRPELVAAPLARPDPAEAQRRGPRRRRRRRHDRPGRPRRRRTREEPATLG